MRNSLIRYRGNTQTSLWKSLSQSKRVTRCVTSIRGLEILQDVLEIHRLLVPLQRMKYTKHASHNHVTASPLRTTVVLDLGACSLCLFVPNRAVCA